MRKIGIIAAVLALSVGTWFFMQKTEDKSNTGTSSEPAAPSSPTAESKSTIPSESEATTENPANGTSETSEVGTAGASAGVAAIPSNSEPGANLNPSIAPAIKEASASKESLPRIAAPGSTAESAPVASAPSKAAPIKKTAPVAKSETAKNCYTFEYRHQESAKSKDIESFLDFSNAFPVAAENVNKKSICVKVNQKPVEFQVLKLKGKKEIVIGPVVGPESIIRVSYCTGAAQCRESCIPQKKRFMDDLLSDAHADDFQDSWGKAGADSNSQELKAKTKELQSLARTNSGLNDRAMMRDWNTLQKQEWTCNQK